MLNYTITPISFNSLIPRSEFKGPILKLTKKEKAKIAELMDKKSELELELVQVNNRLEKNQKTITKEWRQLSIVSSKLEGAISTIEKQIREIKIKRFNKQKLKENKNFEKTI